MPCSCPCQSAAPTMTNSYYRQTNPKSYKSHVPPDILLHESWTTDRLEIVSMRRRIILLTYTHVLCSQNLIMSASFFQIVSNSRMTLNRRADTAAAAIVARIITFKRPRVFWDVEPCKYGFSTKVTAMTDRKERRNWQTERSHLIDSSVFWYSLRKQRNFEHVFSCLRKRIAVCHRIWLSENAWHWAVSIRGIDLEEVVNNTGSSSKHPLEDQKWPLQVNCLPWGRFQQSLLTQR